jgi:hypothetical protein
MKTNRWLPALVLGGLSLCAAGNQAMARARLQPYVPERDQPAETTALLEAEIPVRSEVRISMETSIAIGYAALRDASSLVHSTAVRGLGKAALAQAIAEAGTLLRGAYLQVHVEAVSNRDAGSIAESLHRASAIIDNAISIANSIAIRSGGPAVASSLSQAAAAVRDANAIATAASSSQ